jgi:peptidoglycan/LPS O-acetylase OafA/YrhL
VKYLWPEYNYRHDMVWKLVFRVTAVATALLVAPFLTNATTQHILKSWLIFLPILALAVIIAGSCALWPELKLLSKVRDAYRCEQNCALRKVPGWKPHEPSVHRDFNIRVWAFMVVLFLAAVAYLFIFRFVWLHHLTKVG